MDWRQNPAYKNAMRLAIVWRIRQPGQLMANRLPQPRKSTISV